VADEIIGGYRLVKPMPTGQHSQVWEVVEGNSGRHFAMKMLLPERAVDPALRAQLLHEAEVGKLLTHPNIIRIVTIGKSPTNPYFVMEFFPAGSLKARMLMAHKDPKQKEFLKEKGQEILKQWATALAFMNAKGWVHRDVKPDNLLVNSAGEVRLIDFALAQRPPTGMAKLFRRKPPKAQGTASYMSPEQIRRMVLDGRSDVYSFGASVYELVAGRPPFRGSSMADLLKKHITEKPLSPKEYNKDITKEFGDFVLSLLGKKREERPPSFHEVLMKLRSIRMYTPPPRQPKAAAEG
jgi:serine/threonine protein kinase